MGSDSVDGYDALLRLVWKVLFEKERGEEGKGREGKERNDKRSTQSKLHSLPHLFHLREL